MKLKTLKQPPEVFYKKGVLKNLQNLQENICAGVSFLIKFPACNFIKIETPVPAFCCEFCEIFKNTFYTKHVGTTASEKQHDQGRKQTNIIISSTGKLGIKKLNCLEHWYQAH